jgi:hypothetical protein
MGIVRWLRAGFPSEWTYRIAVAASRARHVCLASACTSRTADPKSLPRKGLSIWPEGVSTICKTQCTPRSLQLGRTSSIPKRDKTPSCVSPAESERTHRSTGRRRLKSRRKYRSYYQLLHSAGNDEHDSPTRVVAASCSSSRTMPLDRGLGARLRL